MRLWESTLIAAELYESRGYNTRFIAVLIDDSPREDIPAVLRDYSFYRLPTEYQAVYRHLTGSRNG